jgi:hypothetical protein
MVPEMLKQLPPRRFRLARLLGPEHRDKFLQA